LAQARRAKHYQSENAEAVCPKIIPPGPRTEGGSSDKHLGPIDSYEISGAA